MPNAHAVQPVSAVSSTPRWSTPPAQHGVGHPRSTSSPSYTFIAASTNCAGTAGTTKGSASLAAAPPPAAAADADFGSRIVSSLGFAPLLVAWSDADAAAGARAEGVRATWPAASSSLPSLPDTSSAAAHAVQRTHTPDNGRHARDDTPTMPTCRAHARCGERVGLGAPQRQKMWSWQDPLAKRGAAQF